MPADPSIYELVKPVPSFADLQNQQLEHQIKQAQLQDYQAQAQQRIKATRDAQALDVAMQQGGGVRERTITALQQNGAGHLIPTITEAFDKADEAANKAKKAKADAETADLQYFGHLAQQVQASNYDPSILNLALDHADENGHDTSQIRAFINQNPQSLKTVVDGVIARSGLKPSATEEQYTLTPGSKRFDASGKVIAEVPTEQKPASATGFTLAPGARRYDADGNLIATAPDRPEKPEKPAAGAAAPPKPIEPGTAPYKVAQDLASGKMTFSQFRTLTAYNRDSGMKMGIYALAGDLNPEFNPSQFELGFKMASNPAIRNRIVAINALGPVIDKVDALADQVGNGDIPVFNKILNSAKFQLGSRQVTNFHQMQILLGDEVGNALGVGTGSDLKTRLGLDLVNPNLSASNFKATMAQLRDVLQARKAELLKQMGAYAPEQPGGASGPTEGTQRPIPSIPGGVAEYRGGKWIRVK